MRTPRARDLGTKNPHTLSHVRVCDVDEGVKRGALRRSCPRRRNNAIRYASQTSALFCAPFLRGADGDVSAGDNCRVHLVSVRQILRQCKLHDRPERGLYLCGCGVSTERCFGYVE